MSAVVVVGIDASASARAALLWSANWARTTGARLRAVHILVRTNDARPSWSPGAAGWVMRPSPESSQVQQDAFGELFNELPPEPGWTLELNEGDIGPELIRAGVGADLIVVGTRQLRGLARIVDDSVSQYVVRHAGCPVLAVPAGPPSAHRPDGPVVLPLVRVTSRPQFDVIDTVGSRS